MLERRNYPESEAGDIVEERDFGRLNTPPVESPVKPPSLKHQTSSTANFAVGDDEDEDEEESPALKNHNPDVLYDRTNTERPWTGSSNKRPESKKHISYDGVNEDRNPWH